MAGHSKWSNIQHRKKAQDAKRSRAATDLIRKIVVAARENPNPDHNRKLNLAIKRAQKENIEAKKIQNAIKKATEPSALPQESIRYDAYGPNGVAILVDVLTDNRNRSVSEVRYTLSRHEGKLSATGSVSWLFEQKGLIYLLEEVQYTETELMELALAVNAEDTIFSENHTFSTKLITSVDSIESVATKLEIRGVIIEEIETVWLPKTRTLVKDDALLDKINHLIKALETVPDVDAVYTRCSWQLS